MAERLDQVRNRLRASGWQVEDSDPLRLTLRAPAGLTGIALADRLRQSGVECEYADGDFLVLMATPENEPSDFDHLITALGVNHVPYALSAPLPLAKGERACSIRDALFAPHETVPTGQALGRICGAPTVSCPPAIPIAVSGEVIGPAALALFHDYGVENVDVLK